MVWWMTAPLIFAMEIDDPELAWKLEAVRPELVEGAKGFRQAQPKRQSGSPQTAPFSNSPFPQVGHRDELITLKNAAKSAIGIGGSQQTAPLPHHPACGSAPGGSKS
jgi:hypothetical protein